MKYLFSLFFLISSFFPVSADVLAPVSDTLADVADVQEEKESFASLIYFTGIGCPHCANTDPVVLKKRVRKGDVMVFEYEIYRDSMNGQLLMEYHKAYGSKLAVPQIMAGAEKSDSVSGDTPVLKSLDTLISLHQGDGVLLSDGMVDFDDLSMVKIPYKPKIWFKNRLAVREDATSLQDLAIKEFLLEGVIPAECEAEKKSSVPLSGGKIKFNSACRYDGWVLMHD